MKCEELTGCTQSLLLHSFPENSRSLHSLHHLLALLQHPHAQSSYLPPWNHCHQRLLEGQRQKLLLPIVRATEAVALREEDDVLLVVNVRLAFVESDLAIEDEVEALGVLLLLEDEGLLSELGEEHGAADMIDGGEVLDALDGLEVEEDAREGVKVRHRPLLGLAHQDLEDHPQVVLLYVVQVQTVEPQLLLAEHSLHSNSQLQNTQTHTHACNGPHGTPMLSSPGEIDAAADLSSKKPVKRITEVKLNRLFRFPALSQCVDMVQSAETINSTGFGRWTNEISHKIKSNSKQFHLQNSWNEMEGVAVKDAISTIQNDLDCRSIQITLLFLYFSSSPIQPFLSPAFLLPTYQFNVFFSSQTARFQPFSFFLFFTPSSTVIQNQDQQFYSINTHLKQHVKSLQKSPSDQQNPHEQVYSITIVPKPVLKWTT